MSLEKITDLDSSDSAAHRPRTAERAQTPAVAMAVPHVGTATPLFTRRGVAELQRVLGNRVTSNVVGQRLSEIASVQRVKGAEPLPGRRKRRRQAEEEELAEMAKANAAWEEGREEKTRDPLTKAEKNRKRKAEGKKGRKEAKRKQKEAEEAERKQKEAEEAERKQKEAEEAERKQKEAEEAEQKKGPTLEAFINAGSDVAKLKAIHFGDISDDLAREMRLQWRLSKTSGRNRGFQDIEALRKAAAAKTSQRADREAADLPSDLGGGRMNARGGQGTGSKKAKKQTIGFDVGTGATWHIHYAEHVKYGTRDETRINFTKRTKAQVLEQLNENQTVGGKKFVPDVTNLAACIAWINSHLT